MKLSHLLRDNYRHLPKLAEDFQLPPGVIKSWVTEEKEPHIHLQKAIYNYLLDRQSAYRMISPIIVNKITQLISQFDLQRLNGSDNYSEETRLIMRSLPLCTSVYDLQELIHAVFVVRFSPSSAGEASVYKGLAEEIWKVWKPLEPISQNLS